MNSLSFYKTQKGRVWHVAASPGIEACFCGQFIDGCFFGDALFDILASELPRNARVCKRCSKRLEDMRETIGARHSD